ncbi:myoglobin [Arapaima gigas]
MAVTVADYDQILKCWGAVEADYIAMGGALLIRLFKEHPDSIKLFPKFVSLPPNEVASNPAVADHGATVLRKLGEVLKTKGNHTSILKPLAETHAKSHNIPIFGFDLLTDAIVLVLGDKAGLDAEGQAAMRRVMKVINTEIIGYYKELGVQE